MGHTPSRHAAAPLLPVAPTVRLGSSARLRAKLQESCPAAAVGRRGEPILPTAGPRGGAGCSGLSRAPEGRPRMPEPRPDPVLGLSLVEALRGLPEAPPGSFQAARAPV